MKLRQLRVCLISREYPPLTNYGGIATFSQHLAAGLVELGHEVDVISLGFDRDTVQESSPPLRVFRVAILPFGLNPWRLSLGAFALAYSRSVWRKVRELMGTGFQYDVIDTPDHLGEGFSAVRARRHPLVVRLYSPYSIVLYQLNSRIYRKNLSYWIIRKMEKSLISKADLVTSPSSNLASLVKTSFGLTDDIAIVPNPIDLDLFKPRPELAPQGPEVKVLFVGRLEHRKGCQTLVKAIPEVVKDFPAVHFTLLGSDTPNVEGFPSMKASLIHHLTLNDCLDHVEFHERVTLDELAGIYCGHDIVVVPSLYDNSPYTCLEAMACGRPVVGTTAGGMPEYLGNDEAGLLTQAGNERELARAIVKLAASRELRETMGRRGSERAKKLYSRKYVSERTVELYIEAIYRFNHERRPG